MDALHKNVKFDLPPSLVESEAKQIAEQLRIENKNVTENQLKKAAKVSTDNTKIAKRRVLLGLLFAEIGRLNNINVSATEFQEALKSQSQQYPGKEQEFFKFVESNPSAQEQIRAPIFEDKVFDYILELVAIKDKAVTVSQLQKELDK
jgi:trigger factor